MESEIKMTELDKDALKETANIGAGNASSVLSDMIHKKVNLVVSDIDCISLKNCENIIKGPKKMIIGIYTPITTGVTGSIIIMFDIDSARLLASTLQNNEVGKESILTDADQKTLRELGNIISESYIESLNKFLDLNMNYDQSNIISTFGESITDIIMLSVDPEAQNALIIKTDFGIELTEIKGQFILLLAIKSIDTLLDTIRSKIA